jgi:hypothetical protein
MFKPYTDSQEGAKPITESNLVEWVVLAIVLLATLTIGIEPEPEVEPELELSQLTGTVILSTRSSMESLGFEEFEVGALATLDLEAHPVFSDGCSDCQSAPRGVEVSGSVVITELIDGDGRLGRVEAQLSITYLREHIEQDFIVREWLVIDWQAGDASSTTDLIIEHSPPRWIPEDRYDAAFVEVPNGKESRTGPWMMVGSLIEGALNARGCLPNNSFCDQSTRPDVNLSATFVEARNPTQIQHPAAWQLLEVTLEDDETPTELTGIRELFTLGEEVGGAQPWCPVTGDEVVAAQSWEVSSSGGPIFSPIGTWLDAVGLPITAFSPVGGTWTEAEFDGWGCASLLDENGVLRLGISVR